MPYFVYILECSNHAYYTGYTTDIKRRYQEHLNGSSTCKYTRSFPPKKLAACWQIDADLALTLKIENFLKKLSRHEKQNFVQHPELLKHYFTSI